MDAGSRYVAVSSNAVESPWRDLSSTRRSLAFGSIWATAGSVVTTLFGPAVTILLVRTMTIGEYGSFAVALAATILLTPLAGFGLTQAVSRAATMEFVRSGRAGLRAVRSASTKLSWLCTLGAIGLAASLTIVIALAPSLHSELVPFAILAPIVVSTPWSQASQGILQATFRPKTAFLGYSVTAILTLLFSAFVLVVARVTADEVALARTMATLIGALIFVSGARWWALRQGERRSEISIGALARLGSAVLLTTTFAICISQLDVFVLGAFKGGAAAGSYAPASRLADFVIMVFGLLGSYLLPALSASLARSDTGGAVNLYQWTSRWAIVLCAPALGILIGSPGPLLQVLFGSSAVLPTATRILALGVLGNIIFGFNGLVLVATGDARVMVGIAIGGLCSSLVACLVLIPLLGANGAALATAIPLLGENVITTLALKRRWGIQPWDRSLRWTLATLAAGLIGATVTFRVTHLPSLAEIAIAAIIVGLPTIAVSALSGGLEDRQLFSEARAAVRQSRNTPSQMGT